MKDNELEFQLKELNPDLFVIVAFRILPRNIFTIPKFGSFNLHGSLLPKYRGAAPIQWALINGDTETGLTTFFLEDKVDTGNIILTEKVEILESDNFETLHDKMSLVGADLVLKTVNLIELNKVDLRKQNDSIATPAPKITKEICEIDWNKTAYQIHNLVRGLSPFPGAFFHPMKNCIKFIQQKFQNSNLKNGRNSPNQKRNFYWHFSKFNSNFRKFKRKEERMKTEEFLRGYSL